ncbi:hypothetical protein O181_063710 [Austropuccinia psidii MF-1]|uniref:Uncharacterized protein n=1 Tax=Austropuccinia psidii MF-1 TaxID=1389203 RepID=A0A9Q3EJ89_9BASI|nr:hypothetical protein [Austropuccinia psidii MF-1]
MGSWLGAPMLEGPFLLVVGQFIPAQRSPTQESISAGHQSSTSPSQPASKIFKSQLLPSTPRSFQQVLSKIPSTIPSTTRPALVPTMRPSPILQPRNSPMVTSQQLQPVVSSSRRREDKFPQLFPSSQVFQKREHCLIRVTREEPNMENKGQDAVARLFRRVDRNIREVIEYANNRTIPGNASQEMAAKLFWYENELINDFKRTFDDLDRGS